MTINPEWILDYIELEIMKFRDRASAQDYLKFQRDGGVPMKGARTRMWKAAAHKWANRVGNIAVIQIGSDPGGKIYLFSDGVSRYGNLDGQPTPRYRLKIVLK